MIFLRLISYRRAVAPISVRPVVASIATTVASAIGGALAIASVTAVVVAFD